MKFIRLINLRIYDRHYDHFDVVWSNVARKISPLFTRCFELKSTRLGFRNKIDFIFQVKNEIFDKIKSDLGPKISSRPWPVNGGTAQENPKADAEDLLITGHEDGSVKFWACGSTAMSLLAAVKTGKFFISDDIDAPRDDDDEDEEEDEWPPFKKVGQFDPYRYFRHN